MDFDQRILLILETAKSPRNAQDGHRLLSKAREAKEGLPNMLEANISCMLLMASFINATLTTHEFIALTTNLQNKTLNPTRHKRMNSELTEDTLKVSQMVAARRESPQIRKTH
jgi:molecular chaperone DnaK (HSP70)